MYTYAFLALELYRKTLDIFKARKFVGTDKLLPTYTCSIGAHIFNIANKTNKIYLEGNILPDTRLHIFMVTVPGFGKTYLINHFMEQFNGILKNSEIDVSKIGALTSSGLVGSIKSSSDGNTIKHKGILERKNKAILGSDEFSNALTMGKASHSSNLTNDLLTALDDGDMNKDQGAGGLNYQTYATLWAATQPGRFELKSGLLRRFAFVVYIPTLKDFYDLKTIRRQSKDLTPDTESVTNYKEQIALKIKQVNETVKEIEFSDEYYKWIDTEFAMHYEESLYERIMIGYWIMKYEELPEKLELKLNDEVKAIIKQQMDTRFEVQKGFSQFKIMELMEPVKEIKERDLFKILLNFSMSDMYIQRSLDVLVANDLLSIKDGIITNLSYKGE